MALAPLSVASVPSSPHPLSLSVLSSILSICLLYLSRVTLSSSYLTEASSLPSSLFVSPLVAFSLFLSWSRLSIQGLYISFSLLHTLFVPRSILARSQRERKKEYFIVPYFLSHKLTLFSLVVNIWQLKSHGFDTNNKTRLSMNLRKGSLVIRRTTHYNSALALIDNYSL